MYFSGKRLPANDSIKGWWKVGYGKGIPGYRMLMVIQCEVQKPVESTTILIFDIEEIFLQEEVGTQFPTKRAT